MRNIDLFKKLTVNFKELKKEVGDYKPETFEYLEKRFLVFFVLTKDLKKDVELK